MPKKLHSEILTKEQENLLPFISKFKKDYYLAGGTAISLYLGHRRSIDFDLFTAKRINENTINSKINKEKFKKLKRLYAAFDQIHIKIGEVKVTFFEFPFKIPQRRSYIDYITIPPLIDLAAMKAFAFGGRSKWKDYVDMYFLLKEKFTLEKIILRADKLFGEQFNGKLFCMQLSYFNDINYSEEVEYLREYPEDDMIKDFLVKASVAAL